MLKDAKRDNLYSKLKMRIINGTLDKKKKNPKTKKFLLYINKNK